MHWGKRYFFFEREGELKSFWILESHFLFYTSGRPRFDEASLPHDSHGIDFTRWSRVMFRKNAVRKHLLETFRYLFFFLFFCSMLGIFLRSSSSSSPIASSPLFTNHPSLHSRKNKTGIKPKTLSNESPALFLVANGDPPKAIATKHLRNATAIVSHVLAESMPKFHTAVSDSEFKFVTQTK